MIGYIEVLIIAVGLAMDALAVSVSSGITIKNMRFKHSLKMALMFGGFQAGMPLLGWWGGKIAYSYIHSFDHLIAFLLLTFIGGKMIYEALSTDDENEKNQTPQPILVLTLLAIATSIDALAVGITFSFTKCSIWISIAIIGIVTFIISLVGAELARKIGHHIGEKKMEILGGIILIIIGIKMGITTS